MKRLQLNTKWGYIGLACLGVTLIQFAPLAPFWFRLLANLIGGMMIGAAVTQSYYIGRRDAINEINRPWREPSLGELVDVDWQAVKS